MGVIGIGVGTAKMGRICRDKDGNITEQSTTRWDADPAGGSVAIWPMDPEKMEPSGPAEVYGDWDAAAYLRRVVELIHPNRQINIPDLEAMIRAAAKAGEDICIYCPDCNSAYALSSCMVIDRLVPSDERARCLEASS